MQYGTFISIFLLYIGMVFFPSMTQAAEPTRYTLAPERIHENTQWSPSDGVFVIESGTTIPTGVTLTISAGTEVRIQNTSSLTVHGSLIVEGTPELPVRITSNKNENGFITIHKTGTASFIHSSIALSSLEELSTSINFSARVVNSGGSLTLKDTSVSHTAVDPAIRQDGGALVLERVHFLNSDAFSVHSMGGTVSVHASHLPGGFSLANTTLTLSESSSSTISETDGTSMVVDAGGNAFPIDVRMQGIVSGHIHLPSYPIVHRDTRLIVSPDASLTIAPGAQMIGETSLEVAGTLTVGAEDSPAVLFSADMSDPLKNIPHDDGPRIAVYPHGTLLLHNTRMEHGGGFGKSLSRKILLEDAPTATIPEAAHIMNFGGTVHLYSVTLRNARPTHILQTDGSLTLSHVQAQGDGIPLRVYGGEVFGSIDTPQRTDVGSNILFLPGIKGSRLYRNDGSKTWEPFGNHDIETLTHNEDGTSSTPGIHTRTDGTLTRAFGVFDVYGSFLSFLDSLVEENILNEWRAAPYDWRHALSTVVQHGRKEDQRVFFSEPQETPYLEEALVSLAEKSRTGKVTIVAHSNGGLVAKELVRFLGDTRARALIERIIFVGVPHLGAPHAIGSLLYGYEEGIPSFFPGIVSTATARAFVQNAPVGYHLLPSAELLQRTSEEPVISFLSRTFHTKERDAYGDTIDSSTELHDFLAANERGRAKPLVARIDQAEVLNPKLLAYARDVHDVLDTWEPPEGIAVHQIGATGLPTLSGITYFEVCVLSLCVPKYRPTFSFEGDGVVPIQSALAVPASSKVSTTEIYLNPDASGEEKKDHGSLLSAREIQTFIRSTQIGAPEQSLKVSRAPSPAYLQITLHSPLALSVHNDTGGIVGEDADGTMHTTIPGAHYGVFGEVQFALVPASDEYSVQLHGRETGVFTLEIEKVPRAASSSRITFAQIPTRETSHAQIRVDGISDTRVPLFMDENGDGIIDKEYTPDIGDYDAYTPVKHLDMFPENIREPLRVPEYRSTQLASEVRLMQLYRELLLLLTQYLELLRAKESSAHTSVIG